jgi:aspartate ammonia-lyase
LSAALRDKGREYADVPKLGRTQLQDAVPMTVDAEFDAWADAIDGAVGSLSSSAASLGEVNLGGTAIGTGLATPARYDRLVIEHLAQISGIEVRRATRLVSATTDVSGLLQISAANRELAVAAAKVANDLRLLSSGPLAGLAELKLPAMQGGSSMMPGKVNPVIPEFVNQVAFLVRSGDQTIVAALDAAQLQLHEMLPVVASTLFVAHDGYAAATRMALTAAKSTDPRSGSAPAAPRSGRASRRIR